MSAGNFHDNQLAAAMQLRSYGLQPNMPGYGYQLNQMTNTGDGMVETPTGPHQLPPQDAHQFTPTPDIPAIGSYPTTHAPEPGFFGQVTDALNDNFHHSTIGKFIDLFHHHQNPQAPNGPQFSPDSNIDWFQNATHGGPTQNPNAPQPDWLHNARGGQRQERAQMRQERTAGAHTPMGGATPGFGNFGSLTYGDGAIGNVQTVGAGSLGYLGLSGPPISPWLHFMQQA